MPASVIGDPRRFDFYVFIETDEGELEEAPSHVLLSAFGHQYWTYPKVEQAVGDVYPVETYRNGSDITFLERPGIVGGVIAAILVCIGALVAVIGWSFQRLRKRSDSGPSRGGAPDSVP